MDVSFIARVRWRYRGFAFALILTIVATGFFLLSARMPLFADDLCRYSPVFDPTLIIQETIRAYLTWSGRFPPMAVSFSILALGKPGLISFDLINTGIVVVICREVARHACGSNVSAKLPALLICVFLLWFTPARFGETFLWKTGAVQYLWGCALALVLLGPVIDHVVWQRRPGPGRWRVAVYCVACLLAGAWLSNLSVAVFCTWSLLMAIDYQRRRRLDATLLAGLIAWGVGSLLLIVAPGNYLRAHHIGYSAGLYDRITTTSAYLVDYVDKRLAIIYISFCIILLLTEHPATRRKLYVSMIFILAGALSVLAMVGAPEISFIPRVAFPFQFFLIAATMSLFPDHLFTDTTLRSFRLSVAGFSLILATTVAINFGSIYRQYGGMSRQAAKRNRIVARARQRGRSRDIHLPPLSFGERYNTLNGSVNFGRYFARDITTNAHNWRNACYAKAHGVASVILSHTRPSVTSSPNAIREKSSTLGPRRR